MSKVSDSNNHKTYGAPHGYKYRGYFIERPKWRVTNLNGEYDTLQQAKDAIDAMEDEPQTKGNDDESLG